MKSHSRSTGWFVVGSSLALGCGSGPIVSDGGDEVGVDTQDASEWSCEGPNAPVGAVELVSGAMQPETFVRVGDRIYWADAWDEWAEEAPSTTLFRTDVMGEGPWVAVASDQPGINQIISDGEAIYWVVEGIEQPGGKLLRADMNDGVTVLDEGLLRPRALTMDAAKEWIYYVEGGELAKPNAKILRIRPDGGSKQLLAESEGRIEDLAIDGDYVWWVVPIKGEVWRADMEGGANELVGEMNYPDQIEVVEGIGWVLGLAGLYRIEIGAPPHFVNGHVGPYELAVDSTHAYLVEWSELESPWLGAVSRYPTSKAELGPLDGELAVNGQSPRPTAVRVDDQALYWATADEASGQGAVWMLCKSAI